MAASFVVCGFNGLHSKQLSCRRFSPLSPPESMAADRCFLPAGRRFPGCGSLFSQRGNRSKMEFVVYSGDQVGDLLPFGIHLSDSWQDWIPGLVLGIVGSFFTNKWGPFAKFKEDLDKVEVMVDNMADQVETMAEKVEDFVGDIANDLPEGSQFRQALERVEKVADTIGDDVKMVSDMVDKMDELEAKMENMIEVNSQEKKTKNEATKKIEPQSTNL